MPPKNHDLHGSAPDKAEVALLLIDVINDLEFPEGDQLLAFALPMAERIAELKRKAYEARVPVAEIGLRLPSLDDVFLTLTGRAAADVAGPDAPAAA